MNFNKNIHHRHSIRLPGCDYSAPGMFFVTMCTENREQLFGEVVDEKMVLNDFGKILNYWIFQIENKYGGVFIDENVIMPNHAHIIILIADNAATVNKSSVVDVGAIHELPLQQRRQMLIPKIVGFLKMNSAKYINKLRGLERVPVWQRNYFEHIIRNDQSLQKIRQYIVNNPFNWSVDLENQDYLKHFTLKEIEQEKKKHSSIF